MGQKKRQRKVVSRLLDKLHKFGIYVYHTATTGTVYLRTAYPDIGTIRIADHSCRDTVWYRWNLRDDIDEPCEVFDTDAGLVKSNWPWNRVDDAIDKIKSFAEKELEKDRVSLREAELASEIVNLNVAVVDDRPYQGERTRWYRLLITDATHKDTIEEVLGLQPDWLKPEGFYRISEKKKYKALEAGIKEITADEFDKLLTERSEQ